MRVRFDLLNDNFVSIALLLLLVRGLYIFLVLCLTVNLILRWISTSLLLSAVYLNDIWYVSYCFYLLLFCFRCVA